MQYAPTGASLSQTAVVPSQVQHEAVRLDRAAEDRLVKLEAEARRVGDRHPAVLHGVAGGIETRCRRLVPLHVGEAADGTGQVAGGVVAVVAAVVVRRGAGAPGVELAT